jgi:hypothetical protein
MKYQELIIQAYKDFNNRNIEAVFESMSPEVVWPNGWEGGYVKGFDEIRNYWTRQWMEIDPVVNPIAFKKIGETKLEVEVQQIIKDKTGKLLFDGLVKHIYTFESGLIKSMQIEQHMQ